MIGSDQLDKNPNWTMCSQLNIVSLLCELNNNEIKIFHRLPTLLELGGLHLVSSWINVI